MQALDWATQGLVVHYSMKRQIGRHAEWECFIYRNTNLLYQFWSQITQTNQIADITQHWKLLSSEFLAIIGAEITKPLAIFYN